MKKLLMLAIAGLIGCSNEIVRLPDHLGRIQDLERRAALNDILNVTQNQLIQLNAENITSLGARLQDVKESLETKIQQEAEAREAGDAFLLESLNDAISKQQRINQKLKNRILALNNKIETETLKRKQADQRLKDLLEREVQARKAGDRALRQELAQEIREQEAKNRQQDRAIAKLQRDLEKEEEIRFKSDVALAIALFVEASERRAGDRTNARLIQEEATARTNADNLLRDAIAAERDARILADLEEAQLRIQGDADSQAALDAAKLAQKAVNETLSNKIKDLQRELRLTTAAQVVTDIVLAAHMSSISRTVSQLNTKITQLTTRVGDLEQDFSTLNTEVLTLSGQVEALSDRTADLEEEMVVFSERISTLEDGLDSLEDRVATLENNQVTIVDPCPTVVNSEILLKVQGRLVAFYQGAEGFLSAIPDGNYRTTDPQKCTFTVQNGALQ